MKKDVHTVEILILSGFLLHDDRLSQMIFVASGASVFDCYMQWELIQMGLLKLIEVNKVFNVCWVCPKWNS